MSNMLVAVDGAIALTTLAMRLLEAAGEINAVLQAAQIEGRDLTDEEIQAVRVKRKAAMDRLDSLL